MAPGLRLCPGEVHWVGGHPWTWAGPWSHVTDTETCRQQLHAHRYVRPIIALSTTARKQEETAPKIDRIVFSISTLQTVFVLMETAQWGLSKSKMLLVSVVILRCS